MRATASASSTVVHRHVIPIHGVFASTAASGASAGKRPDAQQKQKKQKQSPRKQPPRVPNHVPPRTLYALIDPTDLAPAQRPRSTPYRPPFLPSENPSTVDQVAAALFIDVPSARKLVTAVPMFQHVAPQHLHEAMAYLILLLGAPKVELLKLAARHPDLLVLPNVAKQADKLGFLCYLQQRPRLLKSLTRPVFLKTCRPNNYLQQVCNLSKSLSLDLDVTIDTLVACPALITLTYPPELLPALSARLSTLLRFDKEHDFLRSFIMQRPELLLMAAGSGWDELQARARWLEQQQLLGRPLAAVPRLLDTCVEDLAAAMESLASLLDLPHEEALKVAARQPQLLLTNADSLRARLHTMRDLLELPQGAAQKLVVARPRLLTVDAGAMHSCLLLLRQVLRLDRDRLQAVVDAAPQLLAQPPSRLRGNCLLLVYLVTTCSRWRQEFLQMTDRALAWRAAEAVPSAAAGAAHEAAAAPGPAHAFNLRGRLQVLQQPELHTRRLLYLARTGRDFTVWMRPTLMMADEDFVEMFPDYVAWRRARRPPIKLTKQQLLAFQEHVNALPQPRDLEW